MIETNILSGAPAKAEIGTGTIEIGTVTAGDEAAVENVGSKRRVKLNFTLPRGEKGAPGEKGEPGDAAVTAERIEAALGYVPADAPDVLLCTISGMGSNASPYACDKTTAEIYAAFQSGKAVQAKLGGFYYPFVAHNGPQMCIFAGTYSAANTVRTITVTANGKVMVQSSSLEKAANKVTTISANSTDTQYPTAKAVWQAIPQIEVDTIDLDSTALDASNWEEYSLGVFRLQVQQYPAETVLGAMITQFSDGGDASGIIPQVMLADGMYLSVIAAVEAPVSFASMQIQVAHI